MFGNLTEIADERKRAEKEANARVKKEAEAAMKPVFKQFFKDHPCFEKVSWRQYTPHFNDGEICEFGLHGISFFVNGEEYGDYEDSLDYALEKGKIKIQKDDIQAAKAMEKAIYGIENILEAAFGDHCSVTVTPKEITVEEYEHD